MGLGEEATLSEIKEAYHYKAFRIDPISCEGCGVCSHICEQKAIKMEKNLSRQWFISETQYKLSDN